MEQKENDNNDNIYKIYLGIYNSLVLKSHNLLDEGHKAENLQKECLFYCIATFIWKTPLSLLIVYCLE